MAQKKKKYKMVALDEETYKQLARLRVEGGFRSFDATVRALLNMATKETA